MGDGPPPDDFDYGEKREDGQYENHPTQDEGEFVQPVRRAYVHEECGGTTRMNTDIAESYARDPTQYGKTFCATCQDYFPVSEFHWEETDLPIDEVTGFPDEQDVKTEEHVSEATFHEALYDWWVNEVGEENVESEVYQEEPYWFVDLVVHRPEVTWYIEVENDRDSIRSGAGQALGYAADHDNGEPMVIVPAGHVEEPDVERLRKSQAVLVKEFDMETEEFLQ